MTIFREIESKFTEYLVLGLVFFWGVAGFFYFSFNPHYQRNVVYSVGGLYFLWSLYHHYRRGDLHLSIIIEYLVFILLGLIVLSSTFLY